MNTEQNLNHLITAIKILKDLPVMKLAENGQLLSEIKSVINAPNISKITDGLLNDYRLERDAAMNQKPKSGMTADSMEFLKLYAKYQSSAFNIFKENSDTRFTNPVSKAEALAFNSDEEVKGRHDSAFKKATSTKEAKTFEEAFNSIYSDHALQIRTPQDPTTIGSFIDYSPYVWNYQIYLSIPTLDQTIDNPIEIATRQRPKITFNDLSLKEEIEKIMKRDRFTEKVKKMLLYSHLSPRGSLIVPIQEEDRIRFNVFNDTQFTYATSYQYSRIDFRDNMTGVSSLYVLGHLLQNEVTAHFLCPGFEPLYAIGKNKIYQLKDAAEAVNIYLYTIKVLCIRAQILVQQWGGEGQNDTLLRAMQATTDDINSKLSLNTAVTLPEGAKLDILKDNFSEGFSKVSPIIKEYQGMLSGIMPDYYYGSDTAYSANSFNIHATHQNIRSKIQESQIEPIYRFCINKYLEKDKRFEKWKNQIDEFDIEFESLYEPTEGEKVEVATKKISNIISMAGYPELERIFKEEGLLNEEYDIDGEQQSPDEVVTFNSSLIREIDPKTIQPLHEVRYEPKIMRLLKLMDEKGYIGEPLLVIERAMNSFRAITGTHRIQAAEIQGINVPVVVLPSNPVTEKLTTGKDLARLQIIESEEFKNAVASPDLVELARKIMKTEVSKNEKGW